MLIHFDKGATSADIKASLEGSDVYNKIRALQKAIMMLLNGESLPALFITIVRYVLPSEDHTVQKLLLLYLVRSKFCHVSANYKEVRSCHQVYVSVKRRCEYERNGMNVNEAAGYNQQSRSKSRKPTQQSLAKDNPRH